ncbi:hypothetical protein [Sphingobacterium thalpophilum]|uniref:hypothetical protein n=1 Tax=Sphingobacterium thalpophilum TaxID=259 RepID=UPI0024A638E1|nr:hypothetical protein [Sphingobacterium thalpophilum]
MKTKIAYTTPMMETTMIELEQGIAAGSATVRPENSNNEVKEQWDIGGDDSRTIDW